MGVSCKNSCISVGVCLGLGFVVLLGVSVAELRRFDPFYRDIECPEVPLAIPLTRFRFPLQMLPPGAPTVPPPYGLFGSILNTTSQCQNSNQVTATTKKDDFASTLYVPDLSTWKWGVSEHNVSSGKVAGSYVVVASSRLKEDYVLKAESTATSMTESTANTTIDKFLGLFGAVALTGYAPLYTKTVATTEACIHFYGFEFCEKKDTVTWCGLLAGSCQTEILLGGMTMWVPGLCAYTNTVCRLGGEKGEAEMKSLVTAQRLNLKTIDFPCAIQSGFPSTMNCPVAQAPGINATLHQVAIPGYVDGPIPKEKDISDGAYMIETATHLMIIFSAIAALCSFAPCVKFCLMDPLSAWKGAKTAEAGSRLPSILVSQPECKKQQDTFA